MAKSLTSRKRRPLDRSKRPLRDASLIVIATEGSKTEPVYFSIFQDSRVQIKLIPSSDGNSSPQHILENLREYKRDFQLGIGDELWLVGDVDSWPSANLSSVATSCKKEEFKLSFSNPCFEIWLCFHLEANLPEIIDGRSLEKHLRNNLGSFSKSRYDASLLKAGIGTAVDKARALDASSTDRWPQKVGSHVYKLVESILAKTS